MLVEINILANFLVISIPLPVLPGTWRGLVLKSRMNFLQNSGLSALGDTSIKSAIFFYLL
jgi:hypothetical protein